MSSNKLSNTISNKFQSNLSTIPIYKPPSLVDKIITKVKDNTSKHLKIYLAVAIPILILLIYIVYKYRIVPRTSDVINSLDYTSTVTSNIAPLQQCYRIALTEQYKLCDYYISSSFMTPCIGNQHYDYVSNDMISSVIQSGARYIQIPICQADVSYQALPVVATAEYGQKVITSLNTLEISSVFKTIKGNAFKVNNKDINYPLIIHLVLNTINPYTLGVVGEAINDVFSDVLVDVKKYITFPIFLEKLCNLLGKIIIFATPEYENSSSLAKYIVPTSKLFEIYHFSELGGLSMPSDTIFTNSYNQRLSTKQQTVSNLKFIEKYPSLINILAKSDTIGDTILADTDLLDNITCFNKVGMTVIKPQYPSDVISKNYDTTESMFLGCQFITMNFQINDINLKSYLTIFNESSFRLKLDSMRFTETEQYKYTADLVALYESKLEINNNIKSDFYNIYNNKLISFESYTFPNTFMTQSEINIKVKVGSSQYMNNNGKLKNGINQCFIPRKSKLSTSDNISMNFESASSPGQFITLNNNNFILQSLSTNNQGLVNQTFFVENGKVQDNEINSSLYSIRIAKKDNPLYIAFENKVIKAYADSSQIEAHNNMSMIINIVDSKMIINIITLYDGSLKTMAGNIIGVLQNNTTNGTSYYVIPIKNNNNNNQNFDIFKDQFALQNKNTNTYISFDNDTKFLYDRDINHTQNSIFMITPDNGYYTITNINGENLILSGDSNNNLNIIKFVQSKDITTNENLFKLNITYELL